MSRLLRMIPAGFLPAARCALAFLLVALSSLLLRADEVASVIVPTFTAFAEPDDVPETLPDDESLVESDEPAAPPAVEACEAAALRADDELWFISTRCARHAPDGSIRLRYWKYDGVGKWESKTLEDFVAADSALPTCFHIHGNRMTPTLANCGGWTYFTTFTNGVCKPRPPLRWVILNWPSERCCRKNRDDLRTKAVVAECHAFYLAWIVDHMAVDARISMIGYSYGARLIGGALHLLGGGCLCGQQLADRVHPEPRGIRAVFLGGALDNDHMLPGRAFQMAPSQIDHLLVARNGADPALRWYPLLYGFRFRVRTGQEAMGFTGFAGIYCVPHLHGRVENRDVTCLVGRVHDWHGYEFLCSWFLERMRQYVWFEEL